MKNLTIALCMLGASSIVHAAAYMPGSYMPEEADMQSNYSLGVDFLSMQPTGLNFIDGSSLDWASGVRVEASYYLDNEYDITGSFSWFENSSNKQLMVVDFTPIDRNNSVRQSIKDEFWDLNLEFGRTIQIDNALKTRYHVGAKYIDIQRDITGGSAFNNRDSVASQHRSYGFGPRFGVDGEYEVLNSGFSVVGNAAVSALLVNSRFNMQACGPTIPLTTGRTRNIIPGFEARLGGKYVFDMHDVGGQLALEGGYEWSGYPKSIEFPDRIVVDGSTLDLSDQRNFGFNGIYIGLKWTDGYIV